MAMSPAIERLARFRVRTSEMTDSRPRLICAVVVATLVRDRHTCTSRMASTWSADDGSTDPSTALKVLASLMASSGSVKELSPVATHAVMFGRRDITSAYITSAKGGDIV